MEHNATQNGLSRDELYQMLPSVNDLLLVGTQRLPHPASRGAVVNATRSALECVREEIARGSHTRASLQARVAALPVVIANDLSRPTPFSLRKVINATGVILHTNLGRAPLSKLALDHVIEVASGYSNLEMDLDSGERGRRDVHAQSLLLTLIARLTGIADIAETHRVIIVNNCAAATLLALHAVARGREVIVSRGELVEIGGGFRIPEILGASGASLREVGTTNRTHLADYENAISAETSLILRVHQSNFSMDGFVARPHLEELVRLGKRAGVPVFEDQGTGLLQTLDPYGIPGEANLVESFASGCDVVAASGDKLLGGPQCGVLIGRKDLIDKMRSDPLFRTLRVDKLIYAALEGTLASYLSDSEEEIPIMRMLRLSASEIESRCRQVVSLLSTSGLRLDVIPAESVVGGGSAPRARLQSFAISMTHSTLRSKDLLRILRRSTPSIIGRISDDSVLLDLRTVEPESDTLLTNLINEQVLIATQLAEQAGH